MPSGDVLLVLNCQPPIAYRNRRLLLDLYADRFPHVLFTVGPDCPADPSISTLATAWSPRLVENQCACCDPSDRHPSGRHATHPRLVNVAKYAFSRGFSLVVFAEDDCLLSPRITPASILDRMSGLDALIPYLSLCDRDSEAWVWTRHATGYAALDAVSTGLDRARLLRHWSLFSGQPAPPIAYTPLFGSFADMLVFRVDLLLRMVPDLVLLQDVWHEAAIPTAMIHRTHRIGRLDGIALWGSDRDRPASDLIAMLDGKDYVHPVKLSALPGGEVLSVYRRASANP
jgi:hypothetical protein